MDALLAPIRQLPAFRRLLDSLGRADRSTGLGLPRATRLPVLAALHADLDRPLLLVTDRADRALTLFDELGFWLGGVPRLLFPEPNPLFYEQAAWGSLTRRERLRALTALAHYQLPFAEKPAVPPVLVATARALMTRTLPRRDFLKACRLVKVGQRLSPETVLREWDGLGYQSAATVLEPGQFSRRGGILDLWPPAENLPLRLDLFGDEIETIRRFDPASQRTVETLDEVLVTPAREVLPGHAAGLIASLPPDTFSEFHLPLVHAASASLLDYLPPRSLILVDDLDRAASMSAEVEEQAVRFRQESIEEGVLAADFPLPYLPWSELRDSLDGHRWVELGRSTAPQELAAEDDLARVFVPGPRFGGQVKPFLDHLTEQICAGHQAVVVSRQMARLRELWTEAPCPAPTVPEFIEASLSEGWTLRTGEGVPLHLFTDAEIFGWERPQPRARQVTAAETPEAVYADLRPNDLVVHVDHGIGRYLGLVQRRLEGHEREFLCVAYQGDDQLFVPVHQADRLTRYIGAEGARPDLDRLGGQEWQSTRARVKQAVEDVAAELLDLYARRLVARGHAFGTDTHWQGELEGSFPYIETDDQLRALEEIKRDMQVARPMDRLLCGDVGYGKTELALRAAFKAVMDGKQVAMLVPTTVLAQQHYETFRQRLAAYPVAVEMLSRFRTPAEQTSIIAALARGALDIVIGTHRLISGDVQFRDLGLVIIDEEQRFGVTHKEHLKRLRTEVDVLTLTATPIPRTLYMALTGVRDISTLNTPPEERLPIVTHVGPYSPRLVRQAILRELERGGQVFFVHNRVHTIDAMRAHLEKLVPEARVAIGHGQMPEVQLADVMRRFTAGEVDVLLSTSIIESGLDIPNANTLIVDRGDTFGLAQLYQLRGRVGRGAARAYAYFFRHRRRAPTIDGQERLEVIAENTQLGAGYSIAMRDLEIRGAGDLLGTRQHGHIQAVGFHLYTRLLADAVRRMRARASGVLPAESVPGFERFSMPIAMPVNVDLPLAVGIPSDYIPDQDLRLRLYRRIADLRDEAEIDALRAEFTDRFGPPPEMVSNLFEQLRVKLRAEAAGLASVSLEGGQIVLRYPPAPDGVAPRPLPDLGPGVRGGKQAYWCSFGRAADWLELLLGTLDRLTRQPVQGGMG